MKNNFNKYSKLLVICFLIINLVLPLCVLFKSISYTDIINTLSHPNFFIMFINSIITSFLGASLSLILAFLLSYCLNRTKVKYKNAISILITLPMLIPSISHGTGLIFLLGENGIITNLLNVNIHLYGHIGIVLGSMMYTFPPAFLMIDDILKYEDYTPYEAACVLGISKFKQFINITLPYIKKPTFSIFLASFTMIFSDYGVPLTVGGKVMTLPTFMYQEVIGMMDFSKGAFLSLILLVPAMIVFYFDLKSQSTTVDNLGGKTYEINNIKYIDIISNTFCIIICIIIILPIVSFIYLSVVKQFPIDMSYSFNNIIHVYNLNVIEYLINSISISLGVGLLGLIIIYLSAYLTSRSNKSISTTILHLISLLTLAIPGIVLGLSYVLFFNNSNLYGTIFIIIIVNIVHFFASPYLLAYNALRKFSISYEEVASTLGIGKLKLLIDVYLPSTRSTLLEMYSYLFVNSMVTISAVSFLAGIQTTPLSLLIPQFDSQSMIQVTATISLIILVINLSLKLIIYIIKKHFEKGDLNHANN